MNLITSYLALERGSQELDHMEVFIGRRRRQEQEFSSKEWVVSGKGKAEVFQADYLTS